MATEHGIRIGGLRPIVVDVAEFLASHRYGETVSLQRVPGRYSKQVIAYLREGVLPERRLLMLLSGELAAVRLFRGEEQLQDLARLVAWLYDDLPCACWGSPDQVQIWVAFVRRARRDQDHGSQAQEPAEARP